MEIQTSSGGGVRDGARGDGGRGDGRAGEGCIVRRAAYDIGSATTKVKVAEIDRCKREVVTILHADHAPVFYRDDVNSPTPAFTPAIMDQGLNVLRKFAAKAEEHGATESAGVATSAFRRADNGAEMAKRIERELGIAVTIITQAQEARIGFVGAVLSAGVDPKKTVVWDVGGRSMQISTLQPNGRMQIYEGKLASGQMRDYVIREVKGQPATVVTPNPVSPTEAGAARKYAESYAAERVPTLLRDKLRGGGTTVVGIGALKYYGDKPASVGGARCTMAGLQASIDELLNKSDEEIGGSYASTAVSDRILLSGFMNALAIRSVKLVDVELSDGLLFEGEFWTDTPSEKNTPAALRSGRERETAQSIFFRERWGTRVESSPSFAVPSSSVPHIVLQM